MSRGMSLVGDLRDLNRAHAGFQANLGSAKDEAIKASAVILARSWRKVLSVRGGGQPSSAGEAPRRQTGVLARAVAQGIVGPRRIVAQMRFTALWLEEGLQGKGRKRKLTIAPRPAAQQSLDNARADMAGATAQILSGVNP